MATAQETVMKSSNKIPISERVKRLKANVLNARRVLTSERCHIVTEYYKRSEGEPFLLRRANAFREVLEKIPVAIRDDELIVGSLTREERGSGFYPDYYYAWLENELSTLNEREVDRYFCDEKDKKIVLGTMEYWRGRSLDDAVKRSWREQYGTRMDDAIESILMQQVHNRPGGRKSLDNARVLNDGLYGIIEEVRQKLGETAIIGEEGLQKRRFYQAVIISSQAVINFAERYSTLARELAAKEKDPARKQELNKIAEISAWVPGHPARTFYEALQSFWFIHLCVLLEGTDSSLSPGRFDQYMYPFYKRDMDEGRITQKDALELMGCLWVKFNQIQRARDLVSSRSGPGGSMYQNITIGGLTSDGKSAVNELSYLVLDVMEHVRFPQPTVSLRHNDKLPEDFLIRAAEVMRLGGGQPACFNDKYSLTALGYLGVSLTDAYNWVPLGCIEAGIESCGPLFWGYPSFSVAKCLELALNNGFDPRAKKQLGPETGNARQFETYDQLLDAFKRQIAHTIETVVLGHNIALAHYAELCPIPFTSALTNDCLKKGKDIRQGGARYNNLEPIQPSGMVTTGNSLYGIKKLVYEEKTISMDELLHALAINFEGKEELQRKLEAAPKYGNDIDEVDQIVSDVYQICNKEAENYHGPYTDAPLPTAYFGVAFHYDFGAVLGATPDGRRAYTPMADGSLSPYNGTDTKGPTAVIKSASKVHAMPALSTLFNMKFHPKVLQGRLGLQKLLSLIKTYFDLYGYHIQFNVVDRQTLLEAKKNPTLYRDLVIRIAGYTAFFVDLPAAVQDEIIARTEHEL